MQNFSALRRRRDGLQSSGDLVLVKGSRGVRTEKVIEKLLEKYRLEK